MSRVEINADGRHVIVDHTGELQHLLDKALDTWKATEKQRQPRGFAHGGPVHGVRSRVIHDPGCAMLHEPNEPCKP